MGPGDIKRTPTSITPKVGVPDGGSPRVTTPESRPAGPKQSTARSCMPGMDNLLSDARSKLSSGISSARTSLGNARDVATERLRAGGKAAGRVVAAMPQAMESFVGHLGSASLVLAKTADVAEIASRVATATANTPLGKQYGADKIAKALGNGIPQMQELQKLVAQAHMTGNEGVTLMRSFYAANPAKAEETPPPGPKPDGAQPTAA